MDNITYVCPSAQRPQNNEQFSNSNVDVDPDYNFITLQYVMGHLLRQNGRNNIHNGHFGDTIIQSIFLKGFVCIFLQFYCLFLLIALMPTKATGHYLTHCALSLQTHFTHYNDVTMGTMASQITSLTIVYSAVYSGADRRKHQSLAPLAFIPQRASYAENVSIWCRHHVTSMSWWCHWNYANVPCGCIWYRWTPTCIIHGFIAIMWTAGADYTYLPFFLSNNAINFNTCSIKYTVSVAVNWNVLLLI